MYKYKIGDKIKILDKQHIRNYYNAKASIGKIITLNKEDIKEFKRNTKHAKTHNGKTCGIILLNNKYQCNYKFTDFKLLNPKKIKHQVFNI